MKKLIVSLLIFSMIFGVFFTISSSALSDKITADVWNGIELQTIIDMEGGCIYSSQYDNSFVEMGAVLTLRGFALSSDGRYAFLGFLNGGDPYMPAIDMIALDGGGYPCDVYAHYEEGTDSYSYPKGLATDDRGYLYAGLAVRYNYNAVNLCVLKIDENEEKLEYKLTFPVLEVGDPTAQTGTKMGVNGVAVKVVDGEYYLYYAVNYDIDRLYRINITDPEKPYIDESYGHGGYVDFSDEATKIESTDGNKLTVSELSYMDVQDDGTVYIATQVSGGNKSYALHTISPTGQVKKALELDDSYAVALYEEFAVVTAKKPQASGFCATVLDIETDEVIAQIPSTDNANQIVYATIQNDILFLVNQGESGIPAEIYASPLTTGGESTLKALLAKTNREGDVTNEGTDSESESESESIAESESESESLTETEPESTTNAESTTAGESNTEAPTETTTNAAEEQKSGCKSTIALGIVSLLCVTAVPFVIKKKENN